MFDNSPECRRRSMLNKYIGCVTKLLSCPYQTGHFRNGLTPEQCFHTEHHLIVTFSLLVRVQRDREKKLVNICGEKKRCRFGIQSMHKTARRDSFPTCRPAPRHTHTFNLIIISEGYQLVNRVVIDRLVNL